MKEGGSRMIALHTALFSKRHHFVGRWGEDKIKAKNLREYYMEGPDGIML